MAFLLVYAECQAFVEPEFCRCVELFPIGIAVREYLKVIRVTNDVTWFEFCFAQLFILGTHTAVGMFCSFRFPLI
ncbi:hypothetical protein KSC_001120 [Ktedonobacter sp. SOSP1-52]|nr:hypothetical protein KSC_001120 [Ktedonobacter sp. SOSP1-52]